RVLSQGSERIVAAEPASRLGEGPPQDPRWPISNWPPGASSASVCRKTGCAAARPQMAKPLHWPPVVCWSSSLSAACTPVWGGICSGVMSEVTRILSAIDQGDPRAAEQLLPLVYDELRKLAAQRLAREKPGQALQATALVHEAYLRLVGPDPER